jgi:hypothetical protein
MVKTPDIHVDLVELNHSELVLLAKWCGLPASRGMPREMLIEELENFTPTEVPVPFDEKREALSAWIKNHWSTLRMQMPKKVCPNCHQCKDLQILDCYTKNEKHIKPPRARR